MITVYAIRDFINSLDLSSRVTAFSDDSTNTTITVGNVFHSRAGLVVDIDGTSYMVISADYEANSLVVGGVIATPVLLTVPVPFFFHGQMRKQNNELNEILDIDSKVPMFYLQSIVGDVKQNKNYSGLNRISNIILFLLDKSPENGDTTMNQIANIIVPLDNLADVFTDAIFDSVKFGRTRNILQENLVEWGKRNNDMSSVKRFFDMNLTGIAFSFSLPILKCCNN